MTVEVRIPTVFRKFTDGESVVDLQPGTLSDLVNQLDERYPVSRSLLTDVENYIVLQRYVNDETLAIEKLGTRSPRGTRFRYALRTLVERPTTLKPTSIWMQSETHSCAVPFSPSGVRCGKTRGENPTGSLKTLALPSLKTKRSGELTRAKNLDRLRNTHFPRICQDPRVLLRRHAR